MNMPDGVSTEKDIGDRTMSEEHKRLSTIIRDIHLAFNEATEQLNTHSQDQCNEAFYHFYERVASILYKKEREQ